MDSTTNTFKEVFELLPVAPRDRNGDYWMLGFPPMVVSWNGYWFKEGRYVEGWHDDALRGICPEGEDRATDYLLTINGWPVFSQRFAQAFESEFPGMIQFLPFAYAPPSNSFEKRTHCIGQILHIVDAVDRQNALVDDDDWKKVEENTGQVCYPVVLMREEAIRFPVYRTKFAEGEIYVREDVRQFIESHGFTGFRFDENSPILTTTAEPIGPDGKSLRVKAEIAALSAKLDAEWKMQLASEKEYKHWYKKKTQYMVKHLGPESKTVCHAIIPFEYGGGLDLYYYPKDDRVAIATKELSRTPTEGPRNSVYSCYEIVMFTQASFEPETFGNDDSPFGSAMTLINAALERIGRYVQNAEVNPGDTLQIPEDVEEIGGKYFIMDALTPRSRKDGFGLMVIAEISSEDYQWIEENNGEEFLMRMKQQGHFPFDKQPPSS